MYSCIREGALMRLVSLIRQRDWNRPAEVIALDLIYVHNLWKCPVDKIEFGLAQECDPRPDITDDPNSFVPTVIDPEYDDRFAGLNGFMYRRLPISVIGTERGNPVRPKKYPFYAWDEIDAINDYLGIQLRKQDIVNVLYQDEQDEYKLILSPHALVWLPGTIEFEAGPPGPIEGLIRVTALSGFTQFNPDQV